ncbi:class I SAM-dependent methyltransferase [Blautia sp. RD014234]|nr:class I SAM-dependent methyltransferase [Blautia parvula]
MIIFQTFIEMGVKENCEYTSREFAELLNVNLEFQNLVMKWIDILIDEGMMVKTNLGVIICRRDEFEYDLYREMQECQEKERVLKLYKELKENIPATITILRNKYADVEIISKGEFKALPVVLEEISPLDKTMKDVLFSLYKMSLQITGTDSSVLEIGSRMRSNTKRYMDVLGNGGEFYYLDESSEYIDKALEIAGDVNRLKSITYDFKEPYLYIGELRHKMDIIVADNTLHRSYDIELTLSNFKEMLKSGGILLFKEYTIPNRLILNSVALLEKGFSMIQDLRKGTCMPLLSVDKWKELLKNAGFDNIMSFRLTAENAKCGTGETIFIARNHEEVNFISEAEIIERLKILFQNI